MNVKETVSNMRDLIKEITHNRKSEQQGMVKKKKLKVATLIVTALIALIVTVGYTINLFTDNNSANIDHEQTGQADISNRITGVQQVDNGHQAVIFTKKLLSLISAEQTEAINALWSEEIPYKLRNMALSKLDSLSHPLQLKTNQVRFLRKDEKSYYGLSLCDSEQNELVLWIVQTDNQFRITGI